MIPYYRHVCETADYSIVDQCLHCKATWDWSGGTPRFCMNCGIEFKGCLQCRDQRTPRWLYELSQKLDNKTLRAIEDRWYSLRKPRRVWVIETRQGSSGWQKWCVLWGAKTAREAHAGLLRERAESLDDCDWPELCPTEYRLRRCDG